MGDYDDRADDDASSSGGTISPGSERSDGGGAAAAAIEAERNHAALLARRRARHARAVAEQTAAAATAAARAAAVAAGAAVETVLLVELDVAPGAFARASPAAISAVHDGALAALVADVRGMVFLRRAYRCGTILVVALGDAAASRRHAADVCETVRRGGGGGPALRRALPGVVRGAVPGCPGTCLLRRAALFDAADCGAISEAACLARLAATDGV